MSARDILRRATGLDMSELTVARAVRQRMEALALTDSAAYLAQLQGKGAELEALTELVVVPESWMFRDPDAFVYATAFVRARLAEAPGRTVRILSIPCAGGEEPYSMAMALTDAGVAADAFRIDGIDLAAFNLTRARRGRYTRNAFRGGDLAFRERHFSGEGNDYQISEAMRARVNFSQGNLFELNAVNCGGRYDVVFCRNLLIYFDDPTIVAAVARLDGLLADGGLLLAGYAEVPAFVANGFRNIRAKGAFALQKSKDAPSPAPAPAPAPATTRRPRVAVTTPPLPVQAPDRPALPPRSIEARSARPGPGPGQAPAGQPPAPVPGIAAQLATARRLADQGDLAAADAAARAALESNPDTAEAYFILGMVSECGGDSASATTSWRRCIYLQPDHYDALCHLALLCEQAGDSAQATTFRQRAARVFQRRSS